MTRRLRSILAWALVLACASSCASSRVVPMNPKFLNREHAVIGVALAKAGNPGIMDRVGASRHLWPFFPPGPEYGEVDVYSDKGNEQESMYLQESPPTPTEGQLYTQKPRIDQVGKDALKEAAKRFAKEIARPGWEVRPLDLSIGTIDYNAPYLKGLDALVVLDYSWYGVLCSNGAEAGDLADGGADLTGRMTDLATRELLWQSPKISIRMPVWCRCSDPLCSDDIARGVRGAVLDAGEAARKSFTRQTP